MAYSEQEARRIVIEAGHELQQKSLVARTWGNISARISDTEFIITPSGRAYDTLRESDLVKVKIKDCSYEGEIKPSSEKGIHAAAYAERPECNFVIHTHQFYASALCATEKDAPFAPCAGYGLPGTKGLMKQVVACFEKHPNDNTFLMAKHGAIMLGNSYEEAFALAEKLEEQSKELFDKKVKLTEKKGQATNAESEYPYDAWNTSPFVMTYLAKNKKLPPYIDDFAQIVGPNARICKEESIAKGISKRNAVLVKNHGAYCGAIEKDDVEAISMITEKNCAAALYASKSQPLGMLDANLQRWIYLNKYSKQKGN